MKIRLGIKKNLHAGASGAKGRENRKAFAAAGAPDFRSAPEIRGGAAMKFTFHNSIARAACPGMKGLRENRSV
jgi:hypothetical protein